MQWKEAGRGQEEELEEEGEEMAGKTASASERSRVIQSGTHV